MTKKLISTVATAAMLAMATGASAAERTDNRAAVEKVLRDYEAALNASDTDRVMRLYAPDGVFMPQYSPSQVGTAAIRAAYVNVFNAIKLSVTFDIVEIAQVGPEWVLARTNSAGTVTIKATGASGPEANQELFLFHKSEVGNWQIARYSFSSTNPPRQ